MDVLLVHTSLEENLKYPHRARREHLGIGYLLAVLREQGYKAAVIDCDIMDMSVEESVEVILETDVPVIAFAVSSQRAIHETIQSVNRLRLAGCSSHICLGGHFPTFEHQRILTRFPSVNSVVRGEGEYTLPKVVQKVLDGETLSEVDGVSYRQGEEVIENKPRDPIEDLDKLPFPARDTLPHILRRHEPVSVISSRGCYGSCVFCTTRGFYSGSRWRPRDPTLVADELEMLYHEYGASYFRFYDDTFIGVGRRGHERAIRLCEEIKSRALDLRFDIYARANEIRKETFAALKHAGLGCVVCGIESGSQDCLDRLRKHTTLKVNRRAVRVLKELDIELRSTYTMFEPYASLENIEENFKFLLEIGKDSPANYIFFIDEEILPYSGTLLRENLKKEGMLIETDWMDIGAYKFADERVDLLFRIILLIRSKHLQLQRYWVEFDLRRRNVRDLRGTQISDGLAGEILTAIAMFQEEAAQIPPLVFGSALAFVKSSYPCTQKQTDAFCEEQLSIIETHLERGRQLTLQFDTYGV
jgi:anaerobic magnesium-protoporphyrin IX monomethyl ester cyclase